MAKKRRYGESKSLLSRYLYLFILLFLLVSSWLVTSVVKNENPIHLIKNIFKSEKPAIVSEPTESVESLQKTIISQKSMIDSLKSRLAILEGVEDYKQAIVKIESAHLNVRKSPSLSGEVVMKIPPDAEVYIAEYDPNTYILDGKSGSWIRIIYNGQDGWAWGNYIIPIEEE